MQELVEVVDSYNEYINNLSDGLVTVVEQLRNENFSEALINIKNFSEGIVWLSQAGKLINQNNGYASIDVNQITDFLLEINEGLEMQDYVLVADIFEYELIPFCEAIEEAKVSVE
ncbi:hypothetical protein [Lysinibacillus sp. 3P01SB]|uniref:hypothetical protein n=1 Tax=Lysinibacillus sp. 3P01SB TaxID=3132284 RepID=UPI0039A65D03